MNVLDELDRHAGEWTRFAPMPLPGVSLLTARFTRHRYARHVHDGYTVAIIDEGAQTFRYRGTSHMAVAGDIVVLGAEEPHDGKASGESGYRYRTLHIDPRWLADERGRLPDFKVAVLRDEQLRRSLSRLCVHLDSPTAEPEASVEILDATLGLLRRRHSESRAVGDGPQSPTDNVLAAAARRLLDRSFDDERHTVEQIARQLGVSRSHLSRAFARIQGLPPHAWRLHRRLARAMRLLQGGETIATAAQATGFADQSHFSRRFKAVYGVTPGQAVEVPMQAKAR